MYAEDIRSQRPCQRPFPIGLRSATEDKPDTDERAIHGLEGWIACYEKYRLAGTVFAGGVTEPGAIAGHTALETARAMGAAIA